MTYFADLDTCTLFADEPWFLSVGWLEAGHFYSKGAVSAEDVVAMERLVVGGWQPVKAAGWHNCSLCGHTDDDEPIIRRIGNEETLLGAEIIFLPSGDLMYAAPALILHYVEMHGYRPPEEFVQAARATGPARPEYLRECERLWSKLPPVPPPASYTAVQN